MARNGATSARCCWRAWLQTFRLKPELRTGRQGRGCFDAFDCPTVGGGSKKRGQTIVRVRLKGKGFARGLLPEAGFVAPALAGMRGGVFAVGGHGSKPSG